MIENYDKKKKNQSHFSDLPNKIKETHIIIQRKFHRKIIRGQNDIPARERGGDSDVGLDGGICGNDEINTPRVCL